MEKIKKILAIAGIAAIVGWVAATFVVAILKFPGKEPIFQVLMVGCVVLPIVLWLLIWFVGMLTNKKTIASFRNEDMDKTMEEAESIKDKIASKGNLKNINVDNQEE